MGLASGPGLGFTTVAIQLGAIEASDPDAFPQLAEDLGLAAQRVGQQAQGVAQATAGACQQIVTAVSENASPWVNAILPELEPFPGLEVGEGQVLQGQELESWLQEEGELPPTEMPEGGRIFQGWGPNARFLSQLANEFEDAFNAANRDLPVDARLQGAYQYAVQMMGGIDPYSWLIGNPVKIWP